MSNVPQFQAPKSESDLQKQIRYALGLDPRVGLFRNNVMTTMIQGRRVEAGLCKGSSDLIGLVKTKLGIGRFIAIEVKFEHRKASKEQLHFLEGIKLRGGYGCIVRSVNEAGLVVEAAYNCLEPPLWFEASNILS
jgi:hypothetical protein